MTGEKKSTVTLKQLIILISIDKALLLLRGILLCFGYYCQLASLASNDRLKLSFRQYSSKLEYRHGIVCFGKDKHILNKIKWKTKLVNSTLRHLPDFKFRVRARLELFPQQSPAQSWSDTFIGQYSMQFLLLIGHYLVVIRNPYSSPIISQVGCTLWRRSHRRREVARHQNRFETSIRFAQ